LCGKSLKLHERQEEKADGSVRAAKIRSVAGAEISRLASRARRPFVDGRTWLRKDCAMAQQGTVKFFNTEKGYGFIKPDDGGRDIFVHITAVERAGMTSLSEGQKISFEIEPDKKGKGPKAVDLVAL
jgi:cold shock protein